MSKEKEEREKQKDVQEKIRANLEAIMGDMGVSTEPKKPANSPFTPTKAAKGSGDPMDDDDPTMNKIDHPNSQPMNIHEEKLALEKEAKKTLSAVMKFYVDSKYIKKNDYVIAKKRIDEMALSSIMFSLKFTQLAMIKLLEDIDMGNTHPRNFEALATLNNQLMSTIKHQAAYMITLEEGYKKSQFDNTQVERDRNQTEEQEESIDKLDGPVKVRGTKGLMETIQAQIEEAKLTDDDEDEKPRLTDPNMRPINPLNEVAPKNKGIDDDEETEGGYDLDEDYF